MSRIGKKPVDLPSGVTASVSGQTVEVKINKAFSNSLFGVLLNDQLEHLITEGDHSYVA